MHSNMKQFTILEINVDYDLDENVTVESPLLRQRRIQLRTDFQKLIETTLTTLTILHSKDAT